MAKLRKAVDNSHLFIRASHNQGTFQVSAIGEQWLCTHHYPIPASGESISIELGTFRLLLNKGYIFQKGIDYGKQTASSQEMYEDEVIIPDIPLLLHNEEGSGLNTWNLALELSVLSENEQVWEYLQQHHARYVTASGVIFSSCPIRRLQDAFCPLQVQPQSSPYTVFWEDQNHQKKALAEITNPPRLLTNWQGNIFTKSKQQKDYWYHAFPGSAITFPVLNIRWLAKTDYEPDEWPGEKYRIGSPENGWQLWWLTVQDTPVTQEQMKQWLSYRSIDLLPPHQSLKIVSSTDEIIDQNTKKKWYSATTNQSLLLQCSPSRQHIPGLIRDIRLVQLAVNKDAHPLEHALRSISKPAYVEQISYFQWSISQPGRYRISLWGDAISEPLLIHIKEASLTAPSVQWLHGMHCIITSPHKIYTLHAFGGIKIYDAQTNDLSNLTLDDLASLKWKLEPNGLPVYVRWGYCVNAMSLSNSRLITSSEALTELWQNQIWSDIRQSTSANLILDGGSFGLIGLPFIPVTIHKKTLEGMWWKNTHLCSELQWLSNVVQIESAESITTVPPYIYQTLLQLRNGLEQSSKLDHAFNRLLARKTIPTWVYYKLQHLLQKIQKEGSKYETDSEGSIEHF